MSGHIHFANNKDVSKHIYSARRAGFFNFLRLAPLNCKNSLRSNICNFLRSNKTLSGGAKRSYYVALSNYRKVGKKPPYIAP